MTYCPKATMTRKTSNQVKVTRADGSTYTIPAYDRRSMRLILNSTNLSEYDRAMIQTTCPICAARPSRNCRSSSGRIIRHRERIDAYRQQKSTISRPKSDRLES